MLPQKLDKMTLVGTTLIFFAALNWMKLVAYSALGQFTVETLLTSALLLPLAIATNFFGIWLVRRVPHETFYKIAYALMFLISLELIRSGVLGVMPVESRRLIAARSRGYFADAGGQGPSAWRKQRPTTSTSTATRRISSR